MVKGIRMAGNPASMAKSGYALSGGAGTGRVVVFVEETEEFCALAAMLVAAGYQVEVLRQLGDFNAICKQGFPPVAVILDRAFDQDEQTLARMLADMQARCLHRVPVIFISDHQEIAARLAAYRAGATNYLAKPVINSQLLLMLGESVQMIPAHAYRVMLVDDAAEHLAERALMLRQKGMEVSVVNDPLRVPELLDEFAADVLVLGMDMAQCTGPELATILHDDPRYAAIPVVYLSAESDLLLQLKSIKNSSEHYLSKQVTPGHLVSVLSKHAHRHRRSLNKADILKTARYELERQQQAIDSHAIVSVADINGDIVYVNEKFCQISGYSSKELIGNNHRIVKSGRHSPEFYSEMWHTISGGNIWQGEVCNRSKNGDLYWVETSIVPFLDADDLPYQYISIRTDITHVKKNESAMLLAKEAAEAGSRAKSEFLASMSHELRTPLNAILGYSQLFGMDESLPEVTRKSAKQIEHAGRHLLSLVNDLIDLARIESSKMVLALEAVNVKDVVCDSLGMVQSMAHDRGIKIILVQCDVMQVTVWADLNRLRQSIINLLTNAIKYNKPNGTIHLHCSTIEGKARISVSDTGAGIPLDKQQRIFHAFDRLGEERGEVEGTGIGLVITQRIVEAMGGSIGFESTVGQGSTFWLELPLTMFHAPNRPLQTTPEQGVHAAPEPLAQLHKRKPAVLYIEDNPLNMRLMQQVFSSRPEWELRCATTAEIGLEMARENPPDLILMDVNLPGMDGYQALELLRTEPDTAHVRVVALSANAMKGDIERGLKAGFVDYLTKPLDISKLLGVLDKMLA